jgi:hypothetical protein
MLDTKPEIQKKQLEIILAKTPEERFIIGAETIDFGRKAVESSIRQANPEILEVELKIAIFNRYYSSYFSVEEKQRIIDSIKKHNL